jgi:radial spoke head protein 4/6
VEEKPLKSIRLWGKIFGQEQNYIIVEAELKEGANDEDDLIANPPDAPVLSDEAKKEAAGKEDEEGKQATLPEDEDAGAPKPKTKPQVPLTREARTGVNKYVYYVTHYGMYSLAM